MPKIMSYSELHCKTNFSFLEGASFADELVERAAELKLHALAITDRNSLAGVVRAHEAAKARGVKLLIGAELHFEDAAPVLVYAMNRGGYGRLARLLTVGRRRAEKGECQLYLEDLLEHAEGLMAVYLPSFVRSGGTPAAVCCTSALGGKSAAAPSATGLQTLFRVRGVFGPRLSLGLELHRDQSDALKRARVIELSKLSGVPIVACNDVHYHCAQRRFLQDALVCIRHGCSVQTAGRKLFPNGERRLKSAEEMAEILSGESGVGSAECREAAGRSGGTFAAENLSRPLGGKSAAAPDQWLARSVEIADACTFSLDELRYEYPEELTPRGVTQTAHLRALTWAGAHERWPCGVPEKVRAQLEHELKLIAELRYEAYFLTVHDLVFFARGRGILCQGRGSAANSAVCYCLGITSVDPARSNVLFERFISKERNEPPDIDVDFEHERREEVLQYVYEKYGRERAGIVAEVISYRPKSAARDVGKALGLSLDLVEKLAEMMDRFDDPKFLTQRIGEAGLDVNERTMRQFLHLSREILGFPRHLSQHVGGFVITQGPLCELVPIENAAMPDRTVIEWDKDDIDTLGILKVDCLALGMLTCLRKCFDLVKTHYGRELTLATVPPEDQDVYEMCCHADTIGVFQIESRAQMAMLPRLKPRCFYDLVIEVSIVRPGPIQGGMVHPYLRRRTGEEAVTFPSEALREVLGKTLGVPLFQEQVMRLAVVAAGFTPGEADQLRRSMAAWRRAGVIERHYEKFIAGMLKNGYERAFAESVFEQIRGFGEYGFPESHAASFALLVYASAWLKYHYPAAFAAGLLNSQPMGFYAPAQIVRDAQAHGVTVLPVDVNYSGWDCALIQNSKFKMKNEKNGNSPLTPPRAGTPVGPLPEGEGNGTVAREQCSAPCSVFYPEGVQEISRGLRAYPPDTPGMDARNFLDPGGVAEPRAQDAKSENGAAMRLGFREVRGICREKHVEPLLRAREKGETGRRDAGGTTLFVSFEDLARRSGLTRSALTLLASGDAFGSLNLERRDVLWQVLARHEELPLFDGLDADEPVAQLPAMQLREQVAADYAHTGLSLKAHPVSFVRGELNARKILACAQLRETKDGAFVRVAGIVLVRQRPDTAVGVVFVTIEDETANANLILWPNVFQRYRKAARTAAGMIVEGRLQRQGEVIHVVAQKIFDLAELMPALERRSRDFH